MMMIVVVVIVVTVRMIFVKWPILGVIVRLLLDDAPWPIREWPKFLIPPNRLRRRRHHPDCRRRGHSIKIERRHCAKRFSCRSCNVPIVWLDGHATFVRPKLVALVVVVVVVVVW